MNSFFDVFKRRNAVIIGMIHVKALPACPTNTMSIAEIIKDAVNEAIVYIQCGVDAIELENMHDTPYINRDVGPEIVAAMTAVCVAVRAVVPLSIPLGVQILAGANNEALAVAYASNLQFIRAEGFVFGHMADEGMMNACAASLLRYRKMIGANDILIFTDIKKKHSAHSITSDVSLEDTAHAAEFFRSDGVIITGVATGASASPDEVESVMNTLNGSIPVLVGSGVTLENAQKYLNANALIVGSYFKIDGKWQNSLDAERIKSFCDLVKEKRSDNHLHSL